MENVRNMNPIKVDKTTIINSNKQTSSLFEQVDITVFLLPEYKKADYLIKIENIDYGFDGDTLLHSGKYIKYPKNSNCQRWMKRETSRKFRNCQDLPRKGNYYRRLFDYWWTLY